MIKSHTVKWILTGALIMPTLTGCSFFGGDASKEEVAATEGEAAQPEGDDANQNAEAGVEGAETSTADENANAAAISDSAVAAAAEAAAAPAGGGLESSALAPPESLPSNAAPVPAMAEPAAPPAQTSFATQDGSMRVYYVSASNAVLHNGPSASGPAAGSVKKGDPVLVKIEGNWANVVNRGWIELASLSMGPVTREKPAKSWN